MLYGRGFEEAWPMRLLAGVLVLLLVGSSVAVADDGAEPGTLHAPRLLVMRAPIAADELAGYEAFHLVATRPVGSPHMRHKEENEHFGLGEGQVTYGDAVAEWEASARNGDPEAKGNLGVMYDLGLGVVPDPARAVELYRFAADRGWSTAQNNLGIAYALGRGVEQNEAQAVRWLSAASQNGLPIAENTLAVSYLMAGDEISASKWLSRAVVGSRAVTGLYSPASRNLTRLYDAKAEDSGFEEWFWNTAVAGATGWPPVPDGPLEAYHWFDRAAETGFPAAERKRAIAEAADGKHDALDHVIRIGARP